METYDILMLIVLACATIFGAIKGFAWQLASIGSIIVSYLVAYHFREPFSQSIRADPPWNRFLAMLILYVGTSLVIWMVFRMISRTIDRMRLKEFDRQIGALFGLAKGALYCTLITLFAVTLLGDGLREKIVGSKSGHYIAQVLSKSQAVIPPELQEVVQPVLEKFDQRFNEPQGGGLFPAWPAGGTGGDGNSFSEAVFDRFGQNAPATSSGFQAPPWNSPRGATPIDQAIQSGRETAQRGIDQFNRSTQPIAEAAGQFNQAAGQAQQIYRDGRQVVDRAQTQFNQLRYNTESTQQTYGRSQPAATPLPVAPWDNRAPR